MAILVHTHLSQVLNAATRSYRSRRDWKPSGENIGGGFLDGKMKSLVDRECVT
jgi:hypothetical protein